MAVEFWLSYNNGAERYQLPVNPETVHVSSPFGHDDLKVSQLGEYTVIGERGLKEFSVASFFPEHYNATYCEHPNIHTPATYIETIERWRDSRQPIRLIITGTPINYAVTIRDFNYDYERAGNPGDVYFEMTLKEYRFVKFRVFDKSKPTQTPPKEEKQRPSEPKPEPKRKTYTVKSGDSLWKISKRELGNGSDWRKIYNANKKVVGTNPNEIQPGMKLVIPK